MNIKESAQEVVDHLRGLADGSIEPDFAVFGVCYELKHFMGSSIMRNLNNRIFMYEGWEFWSNHDTYPVPHETLTAYRAFNCIGNLWIEDSNIDADVDVRYIELRLDLCDYMADYLEEIYL